jgi:hypothetical protein
MTKKPPRRFDDESRRQAHAAAQAVLAKVRARDEAARKKRAEIRAARSGAKRGSDHAAT